MYILQDWKYNSHDLRIRVVLILFRLSQLLWKKGTNTRIISAPYFIFYRILVVWLFHIELLPSFNVGSRLRLFHGYALAIHPSSTIGDDVTIRHCTTLGNKNSGEKGPQIGNRVNIGSNTVIIGNIRIGDDVTIGAGSVVTKDIPSDKKVAGNPARVLHSN